ncbi:GNAT family N-acetyltransferase [Pseudomonas sp. EA_35y_Pfl2_R111]|uniref:GNAT family N-acetyltransferase n=1 Tax=Pseudomonas sp. EA_35y_Pfl2_R111 TaxID=3088689 RepID=UPI0030D9AD83
MTTPLPTALNLRAYQPQDLPHVVALFQASVSQLTSQHYNATQRQAWAPKVADLTAWQTRLASIELLIAEDSQVIAGFIGFSLDGHIDLLYCAPSHARQGVASALYAAAEERLRAVGAREVSTEASLVAQAFFASQGFSVQQAQTVTRGAVILPRMLMRKTLEPR